MGIKEDLAELKEEYSKGDMSKNEYLKQKAQLEHDAATKKHHENTKQSNSTQGMIQKFSPYAVIIVVLVALYLGTVVNSDNNTISSNYVQISTQQSHISSLSQALSSANSTIYSQNYTIRSLASTINGDNSTISSDRGTIYTLQNQNSNLQSQVSTLQAELSNSGNTQSSLQTQLTNTQNLLSAADANLNMQNDVVVLQKTPDDIVLSNGNSYSTTITPQYSGILVINMTYPNPWRVTLQTGSFPTINDTYTSGTNLIVYLPVIAGHTYTLSIADECSFVCSQYTGDLGLSLLN
jgi:hypothetical protein